MIGTSKRDGERRTRALYVTSSGIVCAVGMSADGACAALRAGLSGIEELPFLDNDGEPVYGGAIFAVPFALGTSERLRALLATCMIECLRRRFELCHDELPLLVGLSEPGRPGGLAVVRFDELIRDLGDRVETRFHPALSRIYPTGHTGALRAIAAARDILDAGAAKACVVAAADSYLNARSLQWLDRTGRLKSRADSDGVIPGEAAACVLLERQPPPSSAAVSVIGLGFGWEAAGILKEEPPLQGFGLTAATRAALIECELGLHEVDFRISDVAGESYGFRELNLCVQRLLRVRKDSLPLWHPADALGDTGAASGLCQIIAARHAFQRGYAPGLRALCQSSAVDGDRAAAILERTAR